MPSASQWFFEQCGLTQWGREPDFVVPKPLQAREMKKLGAALDRAEYERGHMWDDELINARSKFADADDYVDAVHHRLHVADMAYGQALAARNLYCRCKLENSKRIPTHRDVIKLIGEMQEARADIDGLEELGPDFYTRREFLDANSTSALAISVYSIAEQKYRSEEAAARRRNAAYRFAVGNHSRLISADGYVRTGKFKMIDGERVPVLEKIE
jgi:hypothetical protein